MLRALRGLLFVWAAALSAQPQSQQKPAGLESDWDIAVVLGEIGAHAGRLLTALDRVEAQAWIEKGASETYAAQLQSSRDQAKALADGAKSLAKSPERLSAAIELYFRIQGLETMLGSLEQGIRKYQDPALAGQLVRLEAENGTNRDRFQRYIVELASQREQELQVMDKEAQRCRGVITQTAPAPQAGRKK